MQDRAQPRSVTPQHLVLVNGNFSVDILGLENHAACANLVKTFIHLYVFLFINYL